MRHDEVEIHSARTPKDRICGGGAMNEIISLQELFALVIDPIKAKIKRRRLNSMMRSVVDDLATIKRERDNGFESERHLHNQQSIIQSQLNELS
jgi:hypothetical protein